MAKKTAKPSAGKRTGPTGGAGRVKPASSRKPAVSKSRAGATSTPPSRRPLRAPKGSILSKASASSAKPAAPASKKLAAALKSKPAAPAGADKSQTKLKSSQAAAASSKDAKGGSTPRQAKDSKPATGSKPPVIPAVKSAADPGKRVEKPTAKGTKSAKGGSPPPTGKAKNEPPKGGGRPAPKERYSFATADVVAAGKAAAARLAAAAGLHPIRATLNGESEEEVLPRLTKSPFGKKELRHFREILLDKRRQLIGDVTSMETEALTGGSGSLSHLPQHMADQGSDTYDQTLALDLAASQRTLLKEINDALDRIDQGSYGICERLGKPISPERLEHTPWARFCIEAARQLERTTYQH